MTLRGGALGIALAIPSGWAAVLASEPTPSASPTVICSVRVATSSPENLHQVPFAASVLDEAATADAPATTSDALLRVLPGSDRTRSNSAFTNYEQLRVWFSGAGNDRGLVLIDGLPADDGFSGQIDWRAYPAAEIVRAELFVSAGSALYGSGAIGGVLDLTMFSPQNPQFSPHGLFASSVGTK